MRKSRARSSMPADTEEMRDKYRFMVIAWQCVAMRHHTLKIAKDLTLNVWHMQIDYIFGQESLENACIRRRWRGHCGTFFEINSQNEFEIRKHALELVNYEGYSQAGALAISGADRLRHAIGDKRQSEHLRERRQEGPHLRGSASSHSHPQHTSQKCEG